VEAPTASADASGTLGSVFGRSWRIATIRGVPVNVDSSWVWIAVLVTWTLWAQFDRTHPALGAFIALAFAVAGAVLFFGSVFLHEGAHAVAARANGIEVHGITLVLFGGFTSARSESKGPGPAFVIAAVGPLTSLVLGGASWGLSRVLETSSGPLSSVFWYVGVVNLFMAGFNALPGLPLDGGRVLQSAVWRLSGRQEWGTRAAAWGGMIVGALLLVAAALTLANGNPNDMFRAVWFAIIGLFIFQGARAAQQQIGLSDRLARATVADAMEPPPPVVPADISLSEALDRYLRGHEGEAFPVVDEGRVLGMLSFDSARDIGAHDPLRPVRDALIPLSQVLVTSPDEELDRVSGRLGSGGAALVLRDGALVGTITGRGIYRWALARRA
jgi:Zn-dependent protease/CBS domain-containing protein